MSENPGNGSRVEGRALADAVVARRRAQMVSDLRGLAKPIARSSDSSEPDAMAAVPDATTPVPNVDHCDLCGTTLPEDHRHLLHLVQRQIVCSCEACWGMRAGEGDYRPVGNRTLWLDDLRVPDDVWASFQIPIGLAFFMQSTVTSCVVAMYPSPAGATESELHFESWSRMLTLNPALTGLEPDVEGLIVNRMADPPIHVIAPIDRCYALTGTIKAHWEGISGGDGVHEAVTTFFEGLQAEAAGVR